MRSWVCSGSRDPAFPQCHWTAPGCDAAINGFPAKPPALQGCRTPRPVRTRGYSIDFCQCPRVLTNICPTGAGCGGASGAGAWPHMDNEQLENGNEEATVS